MYKKILLVEDNLKFSEVINNYFMNNDSIKIVHTSHDGLDAINYLKENKDNVDLIILDLVMPRKDGYFVLAELKKLNITKDIIVTTSFNSASTIRKLSDYGVKFYMLKPFEMEDLEHKIKLVDSLDKFKDEEKEKDVKMNLTKLLHELGMPSHIKGYEYIREAIILLYDNPNIIGGITKELYPEIANKFNTSVSRVERAIRHAIEVSWNRGDLEIMEEVFGHSVDYDRAKPTNSEFIVTVADKLKLECETI